jgi:hypothetical protein
VEIQNVLNHVAEANRVIGTLLAVIGQAATTPGITPQEFKARMSTDYVQNLFPRVSDEVIHTKFAISVIPDAPPA